MNEKFSKYMRDLVNVWDVRKCLRHLDWMHPSIDGAGSDRVTIRPKRKDKLDGWETINSSVSEWVNEWMMI